MTQSMSPISLTGIVKMSRSITVRSATLFTSIEPRHVAAAGYSQPNTLGLVATETAYLAWVDCRGLGLFGDELKRFVEDEAGLWLDLGDMFGADGDGFIRINIATQRAHLEKALDQLVNALEARISH